MPPFKIRPAKSIRGEISLPGDKSIAHRSIFISAIAKGKTQIYNFPVSRDCLATLRAFKKLQVTISQRRLSTYSLNITVVGRGICGLKKPASAIYAGESGTTFRLLTSLLSGRPFEVTLTAGKGLSCRPMRRVTEPLRRMGAVIKAHRRPDSAEEYPPLTIKGGGLRGITYRMPVASAQVKSALLLAGLYARGTTRVIEPKITRDHTERMLKDFGADINIKGKVISVTGKKELVSPREIHIPADISSAAFFIVAAILLPDSELTVKSVGLNPGRMGAIRVLRRMGADIVIIPDESSVFGSEPAGDIVVKSSKLTGVEIKSSEIPQMIDELPALMLAACLARGRTVICGVQELRVKETDRISSMLTNLSRLGADIRVLGGTPEYARQQEKIVIRGTERLEGAVVKSFGDHRTAMTMVIAGLLSRGQTSIDDTACIAKSFPAFLEALDSVTR